MTTTARGFIGSGDIWLNRIDPVTGAALGWVWAGDAEKFELKANSEIKERESRGRDTYGQVVESVPIGRPAEIAITFAEINRENLVLAFMGETATLSQASGTVTDAAITMRTGVGTQLNHENLTASGFVLTSSPAGTTYADGTDYTVNRRLGIVSPIAGSSLATAIADYATANAGAALPLLVDYGHATISGESVRGAVQPQLRCQIKFDGKNQADPSRPVIVKVWEAVLTPSSAFDFLQDDWNTLELSGRMKTPVGKSEPFVVELRNA